MFISMAETGHFSGGGGTTLGEPLKRFASSPVEWCHVVPWVSEVKLISIIFINLFKVGLHIHTI